MKKQLLFMTAIALLLVFPTNAQKIDPAKVKTFLPFEGNIDDASANDVTFAPSANAAAVGALTYTEGKFGKAIVFDKSPILSSKLGFNPVDGFSISTWYLAKSLPTVTELGQNIVHQKDGAIKNSGRVHLEFNKKNVGPEDAIVVMDRFGTYTDKEAFDYLANDGVKLVADVWYHVTSVKAPDGTRWLYVNGKEVNKGSITAAETNAAEIVIGGAKGESSKFVDGCLDDLLITSEVLTPEQILYIIENGVAKALAVGSSIQQLSSDNTVIFYSNGKVNIKTQLFSNNSDVKVFSLTGKLMYQKTLTLENGTNSFDLNLNQGVYLVKISTEKGGITQKIIL